MADNGKVTEAQAEEALRALIAQGNDDDEPGAATQPVEQQAPAEETKSAEPAAESAAVEEPATESAAPADSDDVASLKARLDSIESERKKEREQHESRLKAIQQRNQENERILRERYLRKSSGTDKALRILKATRTTEGVAETDVDRTIRELESTMNPASASYAPPEPVPELQEDRLVTLNKFLNEKGMTVDEQDEFGRWIKGDGATVLSDREQALAGRDLDGFLRLAHNKWQDGMREKDKQTRHSDAVTAVRAVQRTQKAAVKAASGAGAAPRKQPTAASAAPNWRKMSDAERNDWLASLLKQSVEQYR